MAESFLERAAEGVKASLAAIVSDGGANYWYTPDRVLRAPEFYGGCLPADPTLSVIYTVSPGRVAFTIATAGVAGSRPLAMPVAASSASVRAGM